MSASKCLLIALIGLAFAVTAFAQEAPARQPYEPDECEVAVGGYLFFRIRTPAAGFTVSERQKLVESRLVEIMSNHAPEPVTVCSINGKPTIYVDGVKLITVYPRDLEANDGTCLVNLAQMWAQRVRVGLKTVWPGCQYSAQDVAAAQAEAGVPEVPEATTGK